MFNFRINGFRGEINEGRNTPENKSLPQLSLLTSYFGPLRKLSIPKYKIVRCH